MLSPDAQQPTEKTLKINEDSKTVKESGPQKTSQALLEEVLTKGGQLTSGITLKTAMSIFLDKDEHFDYSIGQFYTLILNNNKTELKKIFEKIVIYYQKSNAYEVNQTKVEADTTIKEIEDCWLAIFMAACIQNNHDFIIHFLDSFVVFNLGFSRWGQSFLLRPFFINFANKKTKDIKTIIMNAIELQNDPYANRKMISTIHNYVQELISLANPDFFDQYIRIDSDLLKFLFESEFVLNENKDVHKNKLVSIIKSRIFDVKNAVDLQLVRFIYEKYGGSLDLKNIWNNIYHHTYYCFDRTTWLDHSDNPGFKPTPLSLAARFSDECNFELLKFLLSVVKVDLKVTKEQLEDNFKSRDSINKRSVLWYATVGACFAANKSTVDKKSFFKNTLLKVIFLLNQGAYLSEVKNPTFSHYTYSGWIDLIPKVYNSYIHQKISSCLEYEINNYEHQYEAEILLSAKELLKILKAAERLLELAQRKSLHNTKDNEEVEQILILLKNGVNGRFLADNKTALQYALESGHISLADRLRAAGANNNIQYFNSGTSGTSSTISASTSNADSSLLFSKTKAKTDDIKMLKENTEIALQYPPFSLLNSCDNASAAMVSVVPLVSNTSMVGLRKRIKSGKTSISHY